MPVTLVPFGQVPKVTIRLVVGAANLHEEKDAVWLADLTGSLMREGTTALTADAVARQFAMMGGELGISVGPDTTSISSDVLAERGADAVKLIADVAQRPRLPESELGRLKGDLLRNLSIQRSTPQAVAQEKFAELVYGDHPYGRLFPREDGAQGFHDRSGANVPSEPFHGGPRPAVRRRCVRRAVDGSVHPSGV